MKTLIKNAANGVKNRSHALTAGAILSMGFVGSANAALDVAVSSAFTSLESSIGDYAAPAYSLLAAVLLFFVGMKWFKKVANRAT